MRDRIARWLAGAALALALAFGLLSGSTQPSVVRGAEPTPTPTSTGGQTNSDPGGGGGGHGGG
jgi:hypothetical protein